MDLIVVARGLLYCFTDSRLRLLHLVAACYILIVVEWTRSVIAVVGIVQLFDETAQLVVQVFVLDVEIALEAVILVN